MATYDNMYGDQSPFAAPKEPWYARIMGDSPGFPALMSRTARRSERTILQGGFLRNPEAARTSKFGRYFQSNINPRSMFKYPSQSIFETSSEMGTSPFQLAEFMNGGMINWVNKGIRGVNGFTRSNIANKLSGGRELPQFGELAIGKPVVSPGFLGRMNSATRVSRGGAFDSDSIAGYFTEARRAAGFDVGAVNFGLGKSAVFDEGSSLLRSQMLSASINGSLTGRISGYVASSRGGGKVAFEANQTARQLGNKAFLRGSELATEHLAPLYDKLGVSVGEKIGAREAFTGIGKLATSKLEGEGIGVAAKAAAAYGIEGAAVAGSMLTGVGDVVAIAGMVKLGLDLGGMAITGGLKAGTALVKEANRGISGPVFGGIYKDSAAAITSRQRGVLAIQNSQLNARSILGNEASQMMAHFG